MQELTIKLAVVTYKEAREGFKIYSVKSVDNVDYALWVPARFPKTVTPQMEIKIEESEKKPGNWKLVEVIEPEPELFPELSNLHYFTGQIFQGLCSYYDSSDKTPEEIMLDASKLAIEYSSKLSLIVKARK